MTSRQLEYYKRNKEKINARRRKTQRKAVKRESALHSVSEHHLVVESKTKPKLRLFAHNVRRKYKLSRKLKPKGQVILKNTTQERFKVKGVSCILTSRSLIVEGVQLWGELHENTQALRTRAEGISDAIALQAQQERLPTLTIGSGITTRCEIALTDTESAMHLTTQHKGKIKMYENPDEELYLDRTPDPAAWESGMKKPASESIVLERWKKGLVIPLEEGRWNVESQLALNQSIIEGEAKRAEWELKFQQSHNELVREARGLIHDLRTERESRKQQRLFQDLKDG